CTTQSHGQRDVASTLGSPHFGMLYVIDCNFFLDSFICGYKVEIISSCVRKSGNIDTGRRGLRGIPRREQDSRTISSCPGWACGGGVLCLIVPFVCRALGVRTDKATTIRCRVCQLLFLALKRPLCAFPHVELWAL
ncbi:unnamed protein product, partial [Ectocarpus sp. 13 AM-2016]